MDFLRFEEMNALQRRLHNAAIVLECEGDEYGFVELLRETIGDIERMRKTLTEIVEADWRKWEELASPDEFVRWAKSRANHALVPPNAEFTGGEAVRVK